MASRAKNDPVGAGDLGRMNASGEQPPASSLGLRVVIFAAVVLLAIYVALAASKLVSTSTPDETEPRSTARLIAARAEGAVAPLRTAARAGLDALGRRPSDPLDVSELTLRLARPRAVGAAVLEGDEVVARSGDAVNVGWAASAARASGAGLWIGARIGQTPGLAYVVAQADPGEASSRAVVLVADLGDLVAGKTPRVRIVAGPDGGLLAWSGVRPATTLAALGLPPGTSGGSRRRIQAAHGGVTVFQAQSPDGTLTAVVGERTGRAAMAADAYSLLAPILIGCGLILTLALQTRRVEAARAAQGESERKFRLAVEAAHCGIWEWRLREERVVMSDVTGVMLGWGGAGVASSADVIARIAPDHRERVREALRNAQSFGAFDVTFCVPRAGGGLAWIDARGQAFGEPDARGFARLIGVALDVTDERTAEQRAQAAERRLHDAIDSVSEAFVLWDRKGRLQMCNRNFRQFFALEPRVLKPGAPRETIDRLANLAVRRSQPSVDGRRGVRELEMTDGRWLQISERRTAEGALVVTAADITAVKRQEEARRLNEEALQHAVESLEDSSRELVELAEKYQAEKIRAESANTAKSEFLANMSHELRTPLNAINGFSEVMVGEMFGALGDRRYKEYAQDILSSGQHLLHLINDILDMSKIEAGKFSLSFDWMEVVDVVQDAARLMRNRAEAAGLDLSVSVAPDLPEIQGDYRAIKQVLLNLISNALKFTPAGGRVEVRAWSLGEQTGFPRVRVAISDTGIGIAKADLERIGKPFAQVETQHSKTQQGTGLGLALTKSLVEMHEGVLELQSEAGLGTTVTFTLPVQRTDGALAPERSAQLSA